MKIHSFRLVLLGFAAAVSNLSSIYADRPLLPAGRPNATVAPAGGFIDASNLASDSEFVYVGHVQVEPIHGTFIRFRIADGQVDPSWRPSDAEFGVPVGGPFCLTEMRLFYAVPSQVYRPDTNIADVLAIDLSTQELAPLLVRLGDSSDCVESPGCFPLSGFQAGGRWVYTGGFGMHLTGQRPAAGEPLANLVRTDQLTGTAEAVRSPEIGGVAAMAADDTRVYVVSGAETTATRYQVVAIDHADITKALWTVPLSDGDQVALFLKDGVLWVTGTFQEIAGRPRPRVAALDPATGALLPKTVQFDFTRPGGMASFRILVADEDHFVVAGDFTSVNGLPRQGLALLDFRTGEVLSWNPLKEGRIFSAAVTTNAVYVVGSFIEIGGVERARFAVFDRLAVPQLRSPQLTSAGFTAQVSAAPGYAHLLQRSPDLRSWQTLSTNTPATAAFTVQDNAPATSPQFYRLLVR